MSSPTKIYPIRDRWLNGVPVATQVIETKGEAEELIATGAFTDNPNDPGRNHDAPDLSDGEPVTFAPLSFASPSEEDVILVKPRPVEDAETIVAAPEPKPAPAAAARPAKETAADPHPG